jgi:hypothetical protein
MALDDHVHLVDHAGFPGAEAHRRLGARDPHHRPPETEALLRIRERERRDALTNTICVYPAVDPKFVVREPVNPFTPAKLRIARAL